VKWSRWLIVLILLVSVASFGRPVHAQTITITALDWTTTTVPMGTVVVNHIRVTSDGPAEVTLSVRGSTGSRYGSFSPNPLVFGAPGTLDSTLTIRIPTPDYICPGESAPWLYIELTVQGRDPTAGTIGGPTLTINLLPIQPGLLVHVEPSKSSYMRGETVALEMDSNLPAQYYLKVTEPDGSEWARAQGYLPATFTKKATDPLGTYTAQLTAYYCAIAQQTATFTITPDTYDVTISLVGLPTDATTALLVDGEEVTSMKGGDVRVLTYSIGSSHTFEVDQYVNGTAGYRYYCSSNSWTANTDGSNAFNYLTQVYLDVSTDPTGVTDVITSGWYGKGSSALVPPVPAEVEGTAGTKYVFITWIVDSTPRSGNGFALVMDAPHKVVAQYETRFLLTVVSDYGNPSGGGYYKSGDTATFSVDSPVGIGIQHLFVEWQGDFSGKDPKGSITMDGPKTVTAVWTTSYFQLYIIIGAVVAIAVVAGLLLWMRSRSKPSVVKPPPPPPTVAEAPEIPKESAPSTAEPQVASKPAVSIALRCTNCGHELKAGQTYCPECGQKQTD
jgi:hypothetical protein